MERYKEYRSTICPPCVCVQKEKFFRFKPYQLWLFSTLIAFLTQVLYLVWLRPNIATSPDPKHPGKRVLNVWKVILWSAFAAIGSFFFTVFTTVFIIYLT